MFTKKTGSESFVLYDKIAAHYEHLYFTEEKLSIEKPFLDKFLSLLPTHPVILDIGCGPGTEARHLTEHGATYIGIDASPAMISIAKKRNPKIKFRVADIRRLPFGANKFDGIMSLESLIHFPKDEFLSILHKCYQILKPNGIILLALEGGQGEVVMDFGLGLEERVPVSLYSLDELKELFSTIGLRIIFNFNRPIIEGEFPFEKLYVIAKKTKRNKI